MVKSPSGSINQASLRKTSENVSSVGSNLVINQQLTEEMPHSSRGLSSPDRRANRGRNQLCTENDNIHDNSSSFKNEDSNKSDDNSYEEAPYEKSNHDMNLILFQGASENLGHEQAPLLKNINFLEANEGPAQNILSSDAMIEILIQKYDDIMLEYN